MTNYNAAIDTPSARMAQKALDTYMLRGKTDGMQLRNTVQAMVIRPLKVFTKDMHFWARGDGDKTGTLPLYDVTLNEGSEDEEVFQFELHPHAFSRMRSEADLSANTVKVMAEGPEWDRRNLAYIMNSKFKNKAFKQRGGGHPRFINLVVGNQVRGFVGRGFKRHLRSGPLLDTFIKACAQYGAMPVEATATDLRITLRCMLPFVFSPREGEYLGLGVSFSNSDFGAGMMRIDLNVMSLRNGRVMPMKTLNGNGRGESHAGGKGDDESADSSELSDGTVRKQITAKQSEIEDLVTSALSPESVNSFFDEVAEAMDNKITWHTFEKYLRGRLTQEEMVGVQELLKKGAKSSELPDVQYDGDDQAIMDLWFASNVISKVASERDADTKEELQGLAGKLLAG